jgi:rhodanese-related sulfurtransferase
MNYAGDVSPEDAFAAVSSHPTAVIVDVRTRPELAYVGYPDLSSTGKQLIAVEWQTFPTGQQNPQFIDGLAAHGVAPDHPVYFLCRSGARSRFAAAAATAAGFVEAYNITDGFEGHLDGAGHRGTTSGWKASDLPWRQS